MFIVWVINTVILLINRNYSQYLEKVDDFVSFFSLTLLQSFDFVILYYTLLRNKRKKEEEPKLLVCYA